MRDRNTQKQIWSDKEFAKVLEKIKARRVLDGKPVNNLGEITKEMLKCPSFKQVENELLGIQNLKNEIKIKVDRRIK